MIKLSRYRIYQILLALWILLITGAETMPLSNFKGHSHWSGVRWIPFADDPLVPFDVVANILLFFPFGFAYVRTRPRREAKTWIWAIIFALLLSCCGELFQVFCHNRIPSTTDVVTNVFGAAAGATVGLMIFDRL